MKQYVKSTLSDLINPADLSKERLQQVVSSTVDILSDSEMDPTDRLLRIIKLYGHYDLV